MEIKIDKENPTNGDMMKAMFPNNSCQVYTDYKEIVAMDFYMLKKWWNAPYEGVSRNEED